MATNKITVSGRRPSIGRGIIIENSGSYDPGVNGYFSSHNFTATGISENGTLLVFVYERRVTTEVTSVLADGKSMHLLAANQGTDSSGVGIYIAYNVDTSISISIKTPAFKIACASWVYLSGFDSGDTVVSSNTKTQTTNTSISNNIVSNSIGDMLFSGINTVGDTTVTPLDGYTQLLSFAGADTNMGQCALLYKELGSPGTYTPGWTFPSQNSQTMASVIVRRQSFRDVATPDLIDFFNTSSIDSLKWDTITLSGAWDIEGGNLHVVKGGNDWADSIILSQKNDFTSLHLIAGIKFPNSSSSRQIVFRSGLTPNSGYGIQLRSGELRLENWGNANLAAKSKSIDPGSWYWVEVVAVGNHILAKTWKDGTSSQSEWDIDFIDTNNLFTTGAVGFSMEESGVEDGYFKEIIINGRIFTKMVSP